MTAQIGAEAGGLADNDHVRDLVQEALSHAKHVVHDLPAHRQPAAPKTTRAREQTA